MFQLGSLCRRKDNITLKPVFQTIFGNGIGTEAGNCMPACLASILEIPLDDIPHFAGNHYEPRDFHKAVDEWLRSIGYRPIRMYVENIEECALYIEGWSDEFVLLSGDSPRGDWAHIVVGKVSDHGYSFDVVHDPHPSGSGLASDPKWVTFIIPRR